VDRPHREAHRIPNLLERTRGWVDPEGGHVMVVARLRIALSVAAGRHVEKAPVAMRPAVLHTGRQCHRITLDQFRVGEIDVVVRKHRPDIGIQRHVRSPLRQSEYTRGNSTAGKKG
jgi:hypothetical protein